MIGQQGLQPHCRACHQRLRIAFVSLRANNPQEMVLILWAFAKVRWGDNILLGTVARKLIRQTHIRVVGVVGGGGAGGFSGAGQEPNRGW